MSALRSCLALTNLVVVSAANSSSLRGYFNTTLEPSTESVAVMGDNRTSSKNDYELDETWSQFYGQNFGREGPARECSGGSHITKWTFHARPRIIFGGIHKIGQVECSNGRRLSCCDGRDQSSQSTDVFTRRSGFPAVEGTHDNGYGFTGLRLCFGGRCSGKASPNKFSHRCPPGSVMAGYKAKVSSTSITAIQFLCRKKSNGGGGGEGGNGRCGLLHLVPQRYCPRDYFSLPPCFRAPVNSLCKATGRCRRNDSWRRNCRGRSIYLKV